jgi:hypothetical protein
MDEWRIGHRLRSRRKRVPQARSQVYMLYTWGKVSRPVEMCCTVCKGSKKLLSIQLHQAVEHNLLTQLIDYQQHYFHFLSISQVPGCV